MSRYLTRKATLLQISPQKSPTRKGQISKNKSIKKKASKEKDSTKLSSKKLLTKVQQPDTSTKLNESPIQESKRRILRRRVSNKDNDKVPTKSKKRKVGKKPSKNVSSSRQMLLKESFLNQSTSRQLRSQDNNKSFNDDGESSTSSVIPGKQGNILSKKSKTKKEKVPVYKSAPLDETIKDGSEIYDFKFDINDSKERLLKKRKKRATTKKTTISKTKRNVLIKRKVKKTEIDMKEPVVSKTVGNEKKERVISKATENKEKEVAEVIQGDISVIPTVEDNFRDDTMTNLKEQVNVDVESLQPQNVSVEEGGSNAPSKYLHNTNTRPTVMSIENLTNKKITVVGNSPVPKSVDFRPFRTTNIFNNKLAVHQKSAINNSLFEKSFSPILKASQNFDPGSPWRVPSQFSFSKVKNVFQSTPQNKIDVASGRLTRPTSNESKNYENVTIPKETELKSYENINMNKTPNLNAVKKKSVTARRFGTVITNNTLVQSSTPVEELIDKIVTPTDIVQNTVPNMQLAAIGNSGTPNISKFDDDVDKENVLNYQTPKIIPKKGIRKFKSHSPQKMASAQTQKQKENIEPIPGPSGMQSRIPLNEQKILRQSNLNNFLNIAEMPQSTTIKTPHRIFDDLHSPPVSRKSQNKPEIYNTEINTAFGFDEENQNESSIEENVGNDENKENIETNKVQPIVKPYARLSIGEIRNTLKMKNTKKKMKDENVQTQPVKIIDLPPPKAKNIQHDITNFSDTFDILSEMEEGSVNSSTVPLFADLEPCRFQEPPRHSYKRKRNVKFSFSEDDSSNEEEYVPQQKTKRKKIGKMKKEDEKRLNDWVLSVNQTFNEIDQYDLLVE